jgi:AraC-like DNA-binding protein
MSISMTISAIITFIENRLITELSYKELSNVIGLSISHIRCIFSEHMGKPLSRYILERKIAHASFELIHGNRSILEIAVLYGFSTPDTFTRAFRRITGVNPSVFRKERRIAGRAKLYEGIYSVSERQERFDTMNQSLNGSMILYGVPKVAYGIYGCTPYPICLKSVFNYLGEDVDYDYIMAMCGAAFRLTWDTRGWNLGNVDVCFTFDKYETVYIQGVEGLGRKYGVIERKPETNKQEFIDFIKTQIDNGRPCIATGIIGPPEACIITGYKNNGETLLGWNFFQNNPTFGSSKTTFDESGYFICDDWWENEDTQSVISIGEATGVKRTTKDIIKTAIEVLSGRMNGNFAKGILAYDAWKEAMSDDREFSDNLTILSERIMCQGDAMDCLADGRLNAKIYFEKLAAANPGQPLFKEIADQFNTIFVTVNKMAEVLGGWNRDEKQMRALQDKDVRRQICSLIDVCKEADQTVLDKMILLEKTL